MEYGQNDIHSKNARYVVVEAGGIRQELDTNCAAWKVIQYLLSGANSDPMIDLAVEWDTSGHPSVFHVSLTDTNSASNSAFINFEKNGVRVYKVDKDGNIHLGNTSGASFITNDHGVICFDNNHSISFGSNTDSRFNLMKIDPENRRIVLASDVGFVWTANTQLDANTQYQVNGVYFAPAVEPPAPFPAAFILFA